MIRILHTSDWHLGKRLERFSRHDEQIAVMEEIIDIAEKEQADVIFIAGDLFDTFNPPAESVDLFYRTLKRLSGNGQRPVIAIAGNHDMPERIEAPDPLARECGIIFAGFPESEVRPFGIQNSFSLSRSAPGFIELKIPGKAPLRILLTPYANEMRLRKGLDPENPENELREILAAHWDQLATQFCDKYGVNVMLTHLLFMLAGGEAPEEPDDERSINHIGGALAIPTSVLPSNLQYVAAGHLHRKQLITDSPCPVVYSGSPLSYSFSEAGQRKQVLMIDLEPDKPALIWTIELTTGKRLERKRFLSLGEAESWLIDNQDSLVELTLVSENFLSGADRRRLNELHNGIVLIIPEITSKEVTERGIHHESVLQKGIEELFIEFFRTKKGQEPDHEILHIFREINAGEDES